MSILKKSAVFRLLGVIVFTLTYLPMREDPTPLEIFAVFLLSTGLVWLAEYHWIFSRLVKLDEQVTQATDKLETGKSRETESEQTQIEIPGNDEITHLANRTDHALAHLNQVTEEHRNALVRQRRHSWILVDLAKDECLNCGDMKEAHHTITEAAAKGLNCSLVSIWYFDKSHQHLICKDLYEALSKNHSGGWELDRSDWDELFHHMEEQRVVTPGLEFVEKLTNLPRHGACENGSALLVAIQHEGVVTGIMCAVGKHAGPWAPDEEIFAISLTDLLTQAMLEEARRNQEEVLRELSAADSLTGLPNRRQFSYRIKEFIGRATRSNQQMAIMFLNLDYFKPINEELGRPAGDFVLRTVAERLTTCIRVNDMAARWQDDSFTVLLDNVGNETNCEGVARKIVAEVTAPMRVEGQILEVACSVGVSLYPNDSLEAGDLIQKAGMAMQHAKESCRGAISFHTAGQLNL